MAVNRLAAMIHRAKIVSRVFSALLENQSFEPVAAKAYRALERMIVTLELAPGSVATEGALIERLGLGRTPVREAIQRLALEGLIEVRPRSGIAIAPLHPSDWVRVLDVRRGVEIILARSAARFVTRHAAERFHAAALTMQKAVVGADVMRFLEADKALDEAMAFAADNPFAARLAAPLQTHSRRFWFRYQSETGLAASAEHHVRVIRAVLEGDERSVERETAELMDLLIGYAEAVASR